MQGLWFLPSLIFGAVQGFTTGNWQLLVFSLISLGIWPLGRWLKSHRDFNLEGPVSFDGKDVWIGEHRLPKREILWRKTWHRYLLDGFAAMRDQEKRPEFLKDAISNGFRGSTRDAIWVGVDGEGQIEFDLAELGPHLLIVGATGTGKSELLRLMVTGWLSQGRAIELTLIDFKGGATLARFASHPRVIALATDLESTDALAIAATLERQLLSRQALLAAAKASDIESYWAKSGNLMRQLIVIDELGELLRQHPRLTPALEQIAARGRSLGMHLIVTNQSMSGISRNLVVNLRARVAIGDMDPIDFSQLGFRNRLQPQQTPPDWRAARLKTGAGFELEFEFPVGF
jgi:hypothetical protein